MIRRSPIFGFALSVAALSALWYLVPTAGFIPYLLSRIDAALTNAHGLLGVVLSTCGVILAALPTVAFMAAQIAVIYSFARFKMRWWQSVLALVSCLVLAWGLLVCAMWRAGFLGHGLPPLRGQLILLGMYSGPLKMSIMLLVMLAAGSVGYSVSLAIRDKNLLLPVVMFAACIDFWTVNFGPVSTMLSRAPEVAKAVMAPIPAAGVAEFRPVTMIGPGDFLFMALVFAVVHRFQMRPRRNYLFVFAMMTLGMLLVFFDVLSFLPALVVLAVAVVGANWGEFKLSREEKISTAIVGLLLAISLPLVWFVAKPKMDTQGQTNPAVPQSVPAAKPGER